MLGDAHAHLRDQIEGETQARQRDVESLRRELYGALRREMNGCKAMEKTTERKAEAAVAEAARAVEAAKEAAKDAAKDAAKEVAKDVAKDAAKDVVKEAAAGPRVEAHADITRELAAGAVLVQEMRTELLAMERRSNEVREMLDQVAIDAKAQVRKVRTAEDNFERQVQVLLRVQEVQHVHQQELRRQQHLQQMMPASQAPTHTLQQESPESALVVPQSAIQKRVLDNGQEQRQQAAVPVRPKVNGRSPELPGQDCSSPRLQQPEQEPEQERLNLARRGFLCENTHGAMLQVDEQPHQELGLPLSEYVEV